MTGWELGVAASATAAAAFGAADFLGGAEARKTAAVPVAVRVQLVGLCVLLGVALVARLPVSTSALMLGAIGGIASGIGLAMLYHALTHGGMGVTIGLGSVVVSMVTLMADAILRGDVPSAVQLVGVACAIAATWLASARKDQSGAAAPIALALASGAVFGLALILLDRAAETSAMWGLVAARGTGSAILIIMLGSARSALHRHWRPIIGAGLLDAAGSALFIGSFVVLPVGIAAAVSAAATPLVAMALAWFILRERVSPFGAAAVGLACVGIALIAVG